VRLTSFDSQRVRRKRWVDELRAEAVPFLGIFPSGAIAPGGVWGSAIASFAASRDGFVECIRVREKTCHSKNSETASGIRLKSVDR
jgi:hypothetical protein